MKLVIALCLMLAAPMKPMFAGWIRSADGAVTVVSAASPSAQGVSIAGRRLYAGDKVKASKSAKLLVFGREVSLTAASGWYVVPRDAAKAPKGRDVYAKFILRAGRSRDTALAERLWLAMTLDALASNSKVGIRLNPSKPKYKAGDRVTLQLQNQANGPLYFTVFDIDPEGMVSPIVRTKLIGPGSSWINAGTFRLALPKGWAKGTETFKVVATTTAADLSGIDTDNTVRNQVGSMEEMDSLAYLLATLAKDGRAPETGSWSVRKLTFEIQK